MQKGKTHLEVSRNLRGESGIGLIIFELYMHA